MKPATAILLTIIVSFVAGMYLPWWSIALVAFLVALFIDQKPGRTYLTGFAGIFLCWFLLAWWMDTQNDHILSVRIARLLPLHGSSFLLILITGLVGGIIGGLAALCGHFTRSYLQPYWPVSK